MEFLILRDMKNNLYSVEDKFHMLLPVRFELSVGTDERYPFGNGLGNDQMVGGIIVFGNRFQTREGVNMFLLYIIDRDNPFILDVTKDVFRRFPSSGLDSPVLKHVEKFLYTLGTDMDDVSPVIKNVKDVTVQFVLVEYVEHENVRVDHVAHTSYFMIAFMSNQPSSPSGCFLFHSPAFDNLPGLASIACLYALLCAYFSASLCAFLAALSSFVMIKYCFMIYADKDKEKEWRMKFLILRDMKNKLYSVEDKFQMLLPVCFELSVGTDDRYPFGDGLGNDQPVGRVVVSGDRLQTREGEEMFFLYIVNRIAQILLDAVKDVFRRFPSSGLDSPVLKYVEKFLYTLGTDMDDVPPVIEDVRDITIQLVFGKRVEYENVRINQIAHTSYFMMAFMSNQPPSPSGCFLDHSPAFDNLPGLASMACLSALLFAYFSASLCAFLAALSSFVMINYCFMIYAGKDKEKDGKNEIFNFNGHE
jgi:hypothetical protein